MTRSHKRRFEYAIMVGDYNMEQQREQGKEILCTYDRNRRRSTKASSTTCHIFTVLSNDPLILCWMKLRNHGFHKITYNNNIQNDLKELKTTEKSQTSGMPKTFIITCIIKYKSDRTMTMYQWKLENRIFVQVQLISTGQKAVACKFLFFLLFLYQIVLIYIDRCWSSYYCAHKGDLK